MLTIQKQAKSYCHSTIQPLLNADGFAHSMHGVDTVLFYAGPTQFVLNEIIKREGSWALPHYPPNWRLAKDEACRLTARRLDDTHIFTFLRSDAFKETLSKTYTLNDNDAAAFSKVVWDYVSNKFSKTSFKKAATLACGADKKSSFYAEEMYGMLRNPDVKIINEKNANLFRDLRALGKDEVHRSMCITALLEMRAYAHKTNNKTAWKNYRRQRKYFLIARKPEKQAFIEKPARTQSAHKRARKNILAYHSPKRRSASPTAAPVALLAI